MPTSSRGSGIIISALLLVVAGGQPTRSGPAAPGPGRTGVAAGRRSATPWRAAAGRGAAPGGRQRAAAMARDSDRRAVAARDPGVRDRPQPLRAGRRRSRGERGRARSAGARGAPPTSPCACSRRCRKRRACSTSSARTSTATATPTSAAPCAASTRRCARRSTSAWCSSRSLPGEDGDRIEVPADFEPALIRVTGKLGGGPPYDGVLRHGGWRARDVRLPAPSPGSDPTILLPAEVEVGAE